MDIEQTAIARLKEAAHMSEQHYHAPLIVTTPESCADCVYFQHNTFPCTAFTVCFCALVNRTIPDDDRERPVWCPLMGGESDETG